MTNAEISDLFSLLSKLMDIHGENAFKSKTYSIAAFQLDKLPIVLSEISRTEIASIPGIGASVSAKIIEILDTGHLKVLDELLAKTPEGILDLLKIKGIGPKKIAVIWHELGVESPGELLYACEENRLIAYKGFGVKTQQSIQEAITFYLSNQQRYLYAQIDPIAISIQKFLDARFSFTSVFISGSFRRQCNIIDELEYVIATDIETIQEEMAQESAFTFSKEEDGSVYYLFQEHIQVVLHCTDEGNTDATLFFTTGTPAFNDAFQEAFPEVSFAGSGGEEDLIFEEAGIPFIEPCLRESKAIIDLAQENKIPSLIQLKHIKGIIHNHSTWSDGGFSIAQMAQACIEKGFEYLVMSDHSVSSFYANGLSIERIKQQQEEIDKLNEKLKPFKIFKSIECDILNDGRLDYPDDILSSFDLVIASVHQNLKMTEEKAMLRLMGAIQNKYTRILGHLTGRLLLSRKEYPVNHQAIIDACKLHDVVIEINANPRRLDMDWQWISYAIAQGVLLSINPDAHSIRGIDDIRYGVLSAQKGMLTAKQNLSSFSLREFEAFLATKK